MTKRFGRILLSLLSCAALTMTICRAQSADDMALYAVIIGPDPEIQVAAGSSYTAQVLYPAADGRLLPFKTSVTWSISPRVEGITIDSKSGKINVASGVAHGTVTSVHASVAGGRRNLQTQIYVFRREVNPLVGKWSAGDPVECGPAKETKVPELSQTPANQTAWRFQIDGQFWVDKKVKDVVGILANGNYEVDVKGQKLILHPKWPPGKQSLFWSYMLEDEGNKLLLRPLDTEKGKDACSLILHH